MATLLLVDDQVRMYLKIIDALKPTTTVIVFNRLTSSLDDIVEQIAALPSRAFTSIGLVQDGTDRMVDYRIVYDQAPCALRNLETEGLASWSPIITFLQSLQSLTGMATFDFISCLLGANPGFSYAITQISTQLGIVLQASADTTGNLAQGGNWIQESDNVNIQDVYFTEAIVGYTGLLYIRYNKPNTGMITQSNTGCVSVAKPVLGMKTFAPAKISAWGLSSVGGTGAPTGYYTAIAQNGAAFAALKSDTTIFAWGSSGNGGIGTITGSGYTAIASAGAAFAALKFDGTIKAWGDSLYGGYGAPTGSGYIAIASSNSAFAALKSDGTIYSWGYPIDGAPTGSGYTAIASSNSAFAALKSDGTIYAWGRPGYGGDGAIPGSYIAIASSSFAFAALKSNGTIYAWGEYNSGGAGDVYGNGYTAIASNYAAFAALKYDGTIYAWGLGDGGVGATTGSGYTSIASTDYAFAALKLNGTIYAWGNTDNGGIGTITGSGYTAIASNGYSFAALKSDGTIYSWGDSRYGGSGAPTDTAYTAIASNYYAFAALKLNGTISAWGESSQGGAGAPTGTGYTAIASNTQAFTAIRSTPVMSFSRPLDKSIDLLHDGLVSRTKPVLNMLTFPSGLINVWGGSAIGGTGAPAGFYTAIASNKQAFAALTSSGTISAWGYPVYGGINDVVTGSGYTAIASTEAAFAALKFDGTIYAWGNPLNGGSMSSGTNQWGASFTGAPTGSGYIAIASNYATFAALKSDTTIFAWGRSDFGGSGSFITGSGYRAIASNYYAFAALKSDGAIYSWGNSDYGGSGAPTSSGYTSIASNTYAFAALKSDGMIKAWGDPGYGGSGAPTGSGYKAIAQNGAAFAALKFDGSISTWGYYAWGGSGAPTGTGYKSIASNLYAFAALKSDGTIKAWGSSSYGGSGAPIGSGYTSIASNYSAFAALKPDGTIYAWGDSTKGGSGAPTGTGYIAIASTDEAFTALNTDGTIFAWGDSTYGGSGAPAGNKYTAIASNYAAFAVIGNSLPVSTVSVTGTNLFTYNRSSQGPNAVTRSGSLGTVVYTYSGSIIAYGPSTSAPIDAGTYSVTAYLPGDSNYGAATSAPFSFTIQKATPTVVLATSFNYNSGSPISGINPTNSASAAGSYYYTGVTVGYTSYTPPTALGTYNVQFKTSDANYNDSSTKEFVIVRQPVTITVSNNVNKPYNNATHAPVYGGTDSSLRYTTNVGNVSVSIEYYNGYDNTLSSNRALSGMRAIGNYTFVITVTDVNYVGSQQTNFNIVAGSAQITLTNITQQYTGSRLDVGPASVTTNGESDNISYTYSATPTQFGSYTVTGATGTSGNYTYTISGGNTFTITKAPAVITVNVPRLTQTYASLNALTTSDVSIVAVPSVPSPNVIFTYTDVNNTQSGFPASVGRYTVTAVATDTNYSYTMNTATYLDILPQPISYYLSPVSATYTTKYLSTFIPYTPNSNIPWTYTGQNISYAKSVVPPSTVGSYTVEPSNVNANLQYIVSGTNIFRILKADVAVTINRDTLTQYYTGSGIGISVTTVIPVSSVVTTYNGSQSLPITLGSNYAVTAMVDDSNYQGAASGTLSIIPVPCVVSFLNPINTFTGYPISIIATTTPAGHAVNLTYDGSRTAPTNRGSYTVIGVLDQSVQQNFYGSNQTTMSIGKLEIPFHITNNIQTYTGNVLTNTSLTNPAGLIVNYTYTPPSPIVAGAYSVSGLIDDSNYMGSAVSTLIITKASAPISFINTKQIYSGQPIYATALTTPSNLNTYSQYTVGNTISPIGPVNVGLYSYTTTINEDNYSGANAGTLNITKLSTLVQITQTQQVYTGSYISTVAVTIPPNLPVSTFYNGLTTPPSSVGSYGVTATIHDSNYAGYTSNILYINKLSTSVVFINLNQNYTGNPISTSAIVYPINLTVNYTYSSILGLPINIGRYKVTGKIDDATYTGISTSILTIQKASTPITFESTQQVYTGRGLIPVAVTTPVNLSTYFTHASNGIPIAIPSSVGLYSTTAYVIDSNNYYGNYGGVSTVGFEITKARATMTFISSQIQSTYTDSSFPIAALRTSPSNLGVTYTYNGATLAPSTVNLYTVVGTIQDTNYMGYGSTILNITKGAGSIVFGTTPVPYNGTQRSTTYTTIPPGMTVDTTYIVNTTETSIRPSSIGVYLAKGVINNSLYSGTKTAQFEIIKGVASIQMANTSVTYDGSSHGITPIITPTLPVSTISYSNNLYISTQGPKDAGTYTATVTVNTNLYSNVGTALLTIDKKPISVALTGLEQVYNGRPLQLHTVTNPAGLASKYTYKDSSSHSILQASSIGTYTVIAELNDRNYSGTQTSPFSIVLGPPNTVNAYPVDGGAIVVWAPPLFASGSPITSYTVRSIPPTLPIQTSNTYAEMSGLTNDMPYLFTVNANTSSNVGIPYQAIVSRYSTEPFVGPVGVAAGNGGIYVLDANNLINVNTMVTYTGLNNPGGIAIHTDGTIYIADTGNHAIRKLTDSVLSIVAGSVGNSGMINAQGASARFSSPKGIAVDTDGNIYVADTGNNRIRKIDTTQNVTTYAGTGVVGNADGATATFNAPQGIAIDSAGVLYVADTGNHIIRKIDTNRNTSTPVGDPTIAGYLNATSNSAKFSSPKGIAINGEGLIFVADTGNNTIRKFDPITNKVTSFAGYGAPGEDDGDGANATFNEPTGICFDAHMNIYVADKSGPTIRKITFTPLGETTPASSVSNNIPGKPTNLRLIATTGSGSITLSWTPPSQAVIPIQSYVIEYTPATQDSNTRTIPNNETTSYTLTGLIGNKEYTVRLRAINLFGTGAYSDEQKLTITRTPVTFTIINTSPYDNAIVTSGNNSTPNITTNPNVAYTVTYTDSSQNSSSSPSQIGVYRGTVLVDTDTYYGTQTFVFEIKNSKPSSPATAYAVAGNGQATVTWTAPISYGESAINSYTIVSNPGAVSVTTLSGSVRTTTVSGLTNGTSYTFNVTAHNAQGDGAATRTLAAVTPVGQPSAPRELNTTRDILGVVTLTWSSPLSTSGFPVTLYAIESLPQNNTSALRTVFVIAGNVYNYSFLTGVTAGVDYKFRVTAYNSVGVGGSAETINSINPNTIPDRPVIRVEPGDRSATLSWTMPVDTGLPVLQYIVKVTPSNRIISDIHTTSTVVRDLNNGTAYSFSVQGVNDLGNGLIGYTRYTTIPFTTNISQRNLPKWFRPMNI